MKHFLIFGTHPRISLAEFRALKPSLKAPLLLSHGAIVDDPAWDGNALMEQLGGTVKLGDIVASKAVDDLTADTFLKIIKDHPRDAYVAFGFSVINASKGTAAKLNRVPLVLKKELKADGVRARWVTAKGSTSLSPAAVAKLKLTQKGHDFNIFVDGKTAYIGLTTNVQNADAWSERDYGRPVRDEKAGMLPPKLARILVNLAQVKKGDTIIDPFCGNGTILMEAALATDAQRIIGSDIDAKQAASSEKNHLWLSDRHIIPDNRQPTTDFITSDVRDLSRRIKPSSIDAVITEGSLGPPLRGSESKAAIEKNRDDISRLWIDALQTLHPLLKNDARLVIVWPSFKTSGGIARVQLDADVAKLGYEIVNPLAGWDESNDPLIYHRQGQKVARRIVVLKKA